MIKVTLRLYGPLKTTLGTRQSQVELPEGATLGQLPAALRALYGEQLFGLLGGDQPFHHLRVLINGRDHFTLRGQETTLAEGDTITIMPPMVGG
jgi:molybdopterin synthase sulfur carrier subunit